MSNIDLCDELNNINRLDNLSLLESINTYTGINVNINILADEEQHLLESITQAPCKYYTINDFKAHFQSFRGITFINYNARSLGVLVSKIRDSLNRLSLILRLMIF